MIGVSSVTNYNRTDDELQEFWMQCILLTDRNRENAVMTLTRFLSGREEYESPFHFVRRLYTEDKFIDWMKEVGIVGYKRVGAAFLQSTHLNLRTCSLEKLLEVHEVSNRSARFFLVHSRADYRGVVLDNHMLRFLRYFNDEFPQKTPLNDKLYKRWEQDGLAILDKEFPGLTAGEIDSIVWLNTCNRLKEGY